MTQRILCQSHVNDVWRTVPEIKKPSCVGLKRLGVRNVRQAISRSDSFRVEKGELSENVRELLRVRKSNVATEAAVVQEPLKEDYDSQQICEEKLY